jgi:dsRNA-specific ribonuclease
MASTIEAIIGAVWEDSGRDLDKVRPVIRAFHLNE